MAIILAGDTHGTLDFKKIEEFFQRESGYRKTDYLIILGDICVLWDGVSDRAVQNALEALPVTTLWIDGNHENFDLLNSYPEEIWNGGRVHFISDSIIHLMRGQVFTIEGKRFFTFGGGYSVDRSRRSEGIDWWQEEIPSEEEYVEWIRNLDAVDWQVDYVLTHTCPGTVAHEIAMDVDEGEGPLLQYLDQIAEDASYQGWFFGHWHIDEEIEEVLRCLYDDIIIL